MCKCTNSSGWYCRDFHEEGTGVTLKFCSVTYVFLRLLPHIKGNVGFVFTKEELTDIRDLILANKVAAPAKAGAMAPLDVFVPKGNTGLGPEKTSFFQALAIPTKIAKGTIEILVSDLRIYVHLTLRILFTGSEIIFFMLAPTSN